MDSIKGELKQAIKLELSQIASQQSPPLQAHDIQLLAARVSTKGSCAAPEANAIGKKTSNMHGDSVGLHVIAENDPWLILLPVVYGSRCLLSTPVIWCPSFIRWNAFGVNASDSGKHPQTWPIVESDAVYDDSVEVPVVDFRAFYDGPVQSCATVVDIVTTFTMLEMTMVVNQLRMSSITDVE
ncbi:hypothetical protein JHK82_050343 [Glycine max]|nr:hypothetical protein JHK82_050343 [Glycine max]